jgi:hypothetical protein
VSAVHVPGGTFIHSAVALAPHAYVLAMEGIVAAVAWVARRRRSWDVASASRVFVGGAVALTVATSLVYGLAVINGWNAQRTERLAVGAALDQLGVPATDRVMSIDSSGFKYLTGRGGVVTTNDSLDVEEQIAKAYDIRWLILERSDIATSFEPILKGAEARPAWIGPPAFTYNLATTDPDLAPYPAAVLYPVCVDPSDTRCSTTTAVKP